MKSNSVAQDPTIPGVGGVRFTSFPQDLSTYRTADGAPREPRFFTTEFAGAITIETIDGSTLAFANLHQGHHPWAVKRIVSAAGNVVVSW